MAQDPRGAGVAPFAHLAGGRRVVGVGPDLEPADRHLPGGAVVDAGHDVDTGDDAVGDGGGAAGLDDLVAKLGVAEGVGDHVEPEDARVEPAVVDGAHGGVAGGPEVGAGQGAQAGALGAVVVVRPGLEHVVTDGPVGGVQDVPVAQGEGGPVHRVVGDAPEGAGTRARVPDADAGHDGVVPHGPFVGGGLGDDLPRRDKGALHDIGRHLLLLDGDRLGQRGAAEGLELLGGALVGDGELQAHPVGAPPVDDLEPNTDARHVRIGQVVLAAGAQVSAQCFG
ncbi:hypothetical protein ACFY2Y_15175 [Janibacter hoylei]|uniref:hypothetical protein n=1 Tax=Janibacter hoylei TaxID=364298 RepID=UPI0036BF8B88